MEHSEHTWGHEPASTSDAVTPSEAQHTDHAPPPDAVHAHVSAAQAGHDAAVALSTHEPGSHDIVTHDVATHASQVSVVPGGELAFAPSTQLQSPDVTTIETTAVTVPRQRDWSRVRAELSAGFQTLLSAAVYATLIVTFGFQVARVDGLSMAPTLEDRDRLIVNKMVYELGDPRPGDIVMLYYPLNPEKMFVKRVIASEGDVVRIVDGRVYVNDLPLHDDYVPEEFRSHDDWGPKVIDQGYYFVMGDHRNNSSDSRHWGLVPKKYIVGKVKLRFWPLHDARIF